ncbi:MAG: integrase core domain-containing protein [Geminicoccales bacterium]
MGIGEVLIAPRSLWQNPYVERVIGSIRRDCLDHVIIVNERHLRRILSRHLDYYHSSRTHLSLAKDTPVTRPISEQRGSVIPFPNAAKGVERARYQFCYIFCCTQGNTLK